MNTNAINRIKFIVLVAVFVATSCNTKDTKKEENKAVFVKTLGISADSVITAQEYIGTMEGLNTVDVSFLVAGNIEQMYVREGEKVDKGKPLAKLDASSFKSAHELALAAYKQAEDAYERMSAMYQRNSLPEIQYVDAKTKLEQARASEAIAKKNLRDGTLKAPFSGVIGTRYLEPGAGVLPNTPVYNVMDLTQVMARIPIPEGEISNINVGDSCKLKISALGNAMFFGSVTEKGIAANPVSHTYDIKVNVDNSEGKIMPGMVCRAYLGQDEAADRIVVPIKSVQVAYSGKRFVWVKSKEGRAVYQQVELGGLFENGVQVISGLKVGDELIVEGYQNISEGALVTVKN